jgi:hypothetical protein
MTPSSNFVNAITRPESSSHCPEPLETQCQSIVIWPILSPTRQVDLFAVQALECFEHRTIVEREQAA